MSKPDLQTMFAPSITCPTCGLTSWNPNDVAEEYCGRCNRFHHDGKVLPDMKPPFVPARVDPFPKALTMASSDWAQIRRLAEQLRAIDGDKLLPVMAAIMSLGLMRSGWPMGWVVRKFRAKLHLSDYEAWRLALKKAPTLCEKLRRGTIRHMLRGKDREDARSVGGFSTRELQTIANIVSITR